MFDYILQSKKRENQKRERKKNVRKLVQARLGKDSEHNVPLSTFCFLFSEKALNAPGMENKVPEKICLIVWKRNLTFNLMNFFINNIGFCFFLFILNVFKDSFGRMHMSSFDQDTTNFVYFDGTEQIMKHVCQYRFKFPYLLVTIDTTVFSNT